MWSYANTRGLALELGDHGYGAVLLLRSRGIYLSRLDPAPDRMVPDLLSIGKLRLLFLLLIDTVGRRLSREPGPFSVFYFAFASYYV